MVMKDVPEMGIKTKAKSPRPGIIRKRRTTLNLDDFLWGKLKDVERKSGAPMSVTVRRMLREAFEAQGETA
jgi:hypothetical protein